TAEAVHGHTGDVIRQTRQEKRRAGDVKIVLAGLVGGAEDDLIEPSTQLRLPVHEGADDVSGEIVGADGGEGTPVATNGRSDGVDDVDGAELGHGGGNSSQRGGGVSLFLWTDAGDFLVACIHHAPHRRLENIPLPSQIERAGLPARRGLALLAARQYRQSLLVQHGVGLYERPPRRSRRARAQVRPVCRLLHTGIEASGRARLRRGGPLYRRLDRNHVRFAHAATRPFGHHL